MFKGLVWMLGLILGVSVCAQDATTVNPKALPPEKLPQHELGVIDDVHPVAPSDSAPAVYQIVYELKRDGKKIDSSSVTVEARKQGQVGSKSMDGRTENKISVIVTPVLKDRVSLDYKFTLADGKRSFEMSRTSVPLIVGMLEKNEFHGSDGADLEFDVTVLQK